MKMWIETRRITPTTTKKVVGITDCYDIKEAVKGLGYRWNPTGKQWETFTEDPLEEMTRVFEAGLGSVETYEKLYATGVLTENYDFTAEQFERIRNAVAPEC